MSSNSKRKMMGGEWSIYLLFRSTDWDKVAAIYELRLTRYKREEDEEEDEIVPHDTRLKLISTFYDQNRKKPISYVACAPLGSSGTFLLLPNEFDEVNKFMLGNDIDYERESPCVFSSITKKKTSTTIPPPLGRKVSPFAMTVGTKVYVLGRRTVIQPVIPQPSFEAFDTVNREWEALEAPPSNVDLPVESTMGWRTSGYAVFGDYIIVCFRNYRTSSTQPDHHAIFSFDTRLTKKGWKRVEYSTPQVFYEGRVIRKYDGCDEGDEYNDEDGGDDTEFRIWSGGAVVINNYMYAYVSDFKGFVSYSITDNNSSLDIMSSSNEEVEFDLSLGKKIVLESDEFRDWQYMRDGAYMETGTVGRIGIDLICMIKTISCWNKYGTPRQPVLCSIFRVLEDGGCIKLNSLDLYIKGTKQFDCALISSVLNPEVVSSLELGERSAKKPAVSNKDDAAAFPLEVEMMETSMA